MRAKYGVVDGDFYNFDETGFAIGLITPGMVVTRADRRGRAKGIQPGNREWATAIVCVNGEGWDVPPFLAVQGVNHLANWYSETDLPRNWVIKPTNNGWTNNETGLEWLKHFDKHAATRLCLNVLIIGSLVIYIINHFNLNCSQSTLWRPLCLDTIYTASTNFFIYAMNYPVHELP